MKGIKYYKGADLQKGHMLYESVEVYKELDRSTVPVDINRVIELYCINKYFKEGMLLSYVSDDKKDWIKKKNKISNALIGMYLSQHTNILSEFYNIEVMYWDEFWELIANRVKLERINEIEFINFLNNQDRLITSIFKQNKLVKHFDKALRVHILANPEGSANLLLNKYLIKHLVEKDNVALPPSLSLDDKEKIINDYLDLDEPNLNYTRLCSLVQSTEEFRLNAKTKLKAKKVSEKLEERVFKQGNQLGIEIVVEFKENVDGVVKQYFTLQKVGTEVDVNWLKTNKDYATILNNFIYIFDFVDKNMVSTFPYNPRSAGVLERFGFNYKNEYRTCMAFNLRESLSLYQIHAYYTFLQNNDIELEDVIEWFFNEYLNVEFDIKKFKVVMPPRDNPNFEKCKSIFPTIESILKKYRIYIEDGDIDEELISIESKPLLNKDCPSKTMNRYVYLHKNNEEARIVENILFSDQSLLTYFKKNQGDSYNSLLEHLKKDKLYTYDVEQYQEQSLNWLITHGYLKVLDDDQIILDNVTRTHIYYLIFMNGVLVPNMLPNSLKAEVKKLIANDSLISENRLFTRQESEYIDYYLNKRKFINGKDLRNAYLHGTASNPDKENEHYTNYLHALKILITIMIKINDDLCTAEDY